MRASSSAERTASSRFAPGSMLPRCQSRTLPLRTLGASPVSNVPEKEPLVRVDVQNRNRHGVARPPCPGPYAVRQRDRFVVSTTFQRAEVRHTRRATHHVGVERTTYQKRERGGAVDEQRQASVIWERR